MQPFTRESHLYSYGIIAAKVYTNTGCGDRETLLQIPGQAVNVGYAILKEQSRNVAIR